MKKIIFALIFAWGCVLNVSDVLAQDPAASVSTPASARAADRALAKSVRKALNRTKGLDASRINVKTSGGTVTLSGTQSDQAKIALAGKAASSVTGVSSVNNRITIFNEGGN